MSSYNMINDDILVKYEERKNIYNFVEVITEV